MNYTLHTDLYQINMGYTYFKTNQHEDIASFEVFYRKNPFNNGHGVFCGLEKIIEIIEGFKFTDEDLAFLKENLALEDDYLLYLKNLRFTGDIYTPKEGEVVFANEPLLLITAPLLEAQILETVILNVINFQTLIATKASKIKGVTKSDGVVEFGARRAHDTEAALWGTRSAYIAGFDGTSLVSAGKKFNIPLYGTHAHSLVQVYDNEYDAFYNYAKTHKNSSFLVDTYNVETGVKTAIQVANDLKGEINFTSIRIDSGDLAYLSKLCRKILDESGYPSVKIIASNDLDEDTIVSLKEQGAKIDTWGVGTKVITSYSNPALGAVYKLVTIAGRNVIKISGSIEKMTIPSVKQLYRVIDKDTNKCICDYLASFDANFDEPLIACSNDFLLNEKEINNYYVKPLLVPIYQKGKLVYDKPSIDEIKAYHTASIELFWEEYMRYKNPQLYTVAISKEVKQIQNDLISKFTRK